MAIESESKERNLEVAFVAFARKMFGYPKRWRHDGWGPFIHERLTASRHGSEHYEIRQYEDYHMLVDESADAIARERETIECIERHLSAGVFRGGMQIPTRVGYTTLPNDNLQRVAMNLLLQPILDMLGSQELRQMSDDRVVDTYRHYRVAWGASHVPWRVIVPLINSTGTLAQRETIGRFSVEPLYPEEKASLQNLLGSSATGELPYVSWLGLRNARYKLIRRFETELTAPDETVESERDAIVSEVQNTILALRLTAAGAIVAPVIDQRSFVEAPQLSHVVTSIIEHVPPDWPPRQTYDLGVPNMQAVATLAGAIERLNRQPARGGLEVALRRFAQSYSRDVFGEDIIIDLTIALESSLLFGLKDELKYRLALRGAALLADESPPSDAVEALAQAKALLQLVYDTRSYIVHRGAYLHDLSKDKEYMRLFRKALPGSQASALPALCENIVRRILRAYIGRLTGGRTIRHIKDINEELESALMSGLTVRSAEHATADAVVTNGDALQ